jgi:monoamine oxidase
MESKNLDVVVIGAGAAGLAASRQLSSAGRRLLILEARGRIGGRIHTQREMGLSLPIELGAEFIHGTPAETWDILRAARLAAYDIADTHWFLQGQTLSRDLKFWEEIEAVFSRIAKVSEPDLSFAEFLGRYCADVPERVKGMALAFVEGFDAADPQRAGVRGLAEEQQASAETEEERSFRVIAGYDRVIAFLAAGLDPKRCEIRLNTIVTEVRWEKGSVHVVGLSGGVQQTFEAKRVLVTIPLGVWKAGLSETGAIGFTPDLTEKREAIARLEMGSIIKIVLQFREPFWETEQFATLPMGESLRDACFLHAHGPRVFTWWTMLPVRANLLVGWSGGPSAQALSCRNSDEVVQEALISLSQFLNMNVSELGLRLERATVADWQADPFSRGAYSYTGVGGIGAREALARPVEGTLFCAGEATHAGQSGTVAGAIASGYRAAAEIIEAER